MRKVVKRESNVNDITEKERKKKGGREEVNAHEQGWVRSLLRTTTQVSDTYVQQCGNNNTLH